jgi:ABC-type multidrug transport system fused ATPase/permease subunit
MKNNEEKFKKIKLILRLLAYTKHYRALFIIVLLLIGMSTILSLVPTYIIKPLTDKVFLPQVSTTDSARIRMLNMLVLVIILAHLGQILINSIAEYRKKCLGEKISADLRAAIYAHLQRLSMKFYDFEKTGSLHTRIFYDTSLFDFFITNNLTSLFVSLVMSLGIGLFLFRLNWRLAALLLMPAPFIVLLTFTWGEKIFFAYRVSAQRLANLSSLVFRNIMRVIVVKTNVAEKRELLIFNRANMDFFAGRLQAKRATLSVLPLKNFLILLSGNLIYWIGGRYVINGEMTLGGLMVFVGYMWQFYGPIEKFGDIYSSFQDVVASAEKVFKVLDTEPDIYDRQDAIYLPARIKGSIRFENVTFAYDGKRNVLENINLEAKPGEIIGITGPSGAGKSTLLHLLCRLYDVADGHIFFDGNDIRNIKLESLRNQIGIVLQGTLLFYGTIAENIAYSKPDAAGGDIIAAAKAAGAHDFIMRLPDAYDTVMGEDGVGLSGGERQRISIARVLLRNQKVIVFDEATSAVDLETEAFIQTTIEKLAGEHTIFIISHRLSMLKDSNKLIILDEGKIVESGHIEVLNKNEGSFSRLLM